MKEQTLRLLIVEDDMIIAANISLQLTRLGYEVVAIIPSAEEALRFLEEQTTDIILLDIHLRGAKDGIDLAEIVRDSYQTPVIFLTSNTDEATFNRAKATQPYAFIAKPFKKIDLQRAIELTCARIAQEPETTHKKAPSYAQGDESFVLKDRIFIRQQDKMVKLYLHDILYALADRNYCALHTSNKVYLLTTPLKKLEEQLPEASFLRIHRSHLINIDKIDAVSEQFTSVSIGAERLIVSSSYQSLLAQRLKTI